MQLPEIRFQIHSELFEEYAYTLRVLGQNIGYKPVFVDAEAEISENVIIVAEHGLCDISVSHFFRSHYQQGDFDFKVYFKKELLHFTAAGKPDYLSTCFYLLAYVQEYTEYIPDKYDRFPFKNSVQHAFNCVEENLVAFYFELLLQSTPKLSSQLIKQINPSRFFLTHDIDTLYGALRENAKPLLRQGRIGLLLQIIFSHYIRTPDFMLLDKIMQMENAHDVKSTFFWLVSNNKRESGMINPDYSIQEKRVQDLLQKIVDEKFSNGLHKSYSKKNYADEIKLLGKFTAPYNRNHYLQSELPNTFDAIENAGIKLDTTMGFAEASGFRNSYGLPQSPFCLKERRPYSFIETPLVIMDASLRHYKKYSPSEASNFILQFLDKNKQNAVITILWHNNYFFDYAEPDWLNCYKSILSFIIENRLKSITPDEIISTYSISE